MILYQWPPAEIVTSAEPIEFVRNGVDTQVSQDTVTPSNSRPLPVGVLNISGSQINPLTDTELRATPVPVSASSLPLPSGAATAANQTTQISELQDIEADIEAMSAKLPATLGQKTMANSLAVVIASDQSAVPVSAASLPLPTGAATEATLSSLNGKVANDFGASSGAVRTASQVGNSTGAADFNSGAAGAQTLRTVLATRHEAAATPLASRLSDGADFISSEALAASQKTVSTLTKMLTTLGVMLGWDGTAHREIAVTTTGLVKTTTGTGSAQADGGSVSNATVDATADTVSAPANAIGFILAADDDNADPIYWAIGSTATSTNGQRMAPGRDSGFVPCGANISVLGSANNPRYNIQWFTRS